MSLERSVTLSTPVLGFTPYALIVREPDSDEFVLTTGGVTSPEGLLSLSRQVSFGARQLRKVARRINRNARTENRAAKRAAKREAKS